MKCIYCESEDTRVIETREAGENVRRRRECPSCQERFTTYERVERQPLRVIKKDGSREMFDREKLKRGLLVACEKRPVSLEQIEDALQSIELALRKQTEQEIQTQLIGDLTIAELKKLDPVAYIRFASVYKEFTDLHSFTEEIKILTRGN